MRIDSYINFNGNCKEAVAFYANIFGSAQPKHMLFADMPPDAAYPMTDDIKNLVMHTSLTIGESVLMFSDVPPSMPAQAGTNMSLIVSSNDIPMLKKWAYALSKGGKTNMVLAETFWSKCYGMVTDKFGIIWQFNYAEK